MAAYASSSAGHANAQAMNVEFYIEVHGLTAAPWRFRRDGTRKPSRDPTEHTLSRGSVCFFFDGLTTRGLPQIPDHVREHVLDAFSIYQSDEKFTVAPCDVTKMSRNSNSGSGSDEEEETIDWRRLTFQKVEAAGGQRRVSYVSVRQDHTQLIIQRSDQTWPARLFPDPYLALRADRNSSDPRKGGLVGRLALLVGLLVMSLPQRWEVVQHRLPLMIRHSPTDGRPAWMADHPAPARGIGWEHPRGLVITIYFDHTRTTEAILRHYERGGFGVLFR